MAAPFEEADERPLDEDAERRCTGPAGSVGVFDTRAGASVDGLFDPPA